MFPIPRVLSPSPAYPRRDTNQFGSLITMQKPATGVLGTLPRRRYATTCQPSRER
jgi:hypothetical protein